MRASVGQPGIRAVLYVIDMIQLFMRWPWAAPDRARKSQALLKSCQRLSALSGEAPDKADKMIEAPGREARTRAIEVAEVTYWLLAGMGPEVTRAMPQRERARWPRWRRAERQK